MNHRSYHVGFRGSLFYLWPLLFIVVAGWVIHRCMLGSAEGPPPPVILNFVRVPWLACIAVFVILFLFRAAKSYRLQVFEHHGTLTECLLGMELRKISVDSHSKFRLEVPMAAPGGGALSPAILFTEPRKLRMGKGLSIADLTDIVARLSASESAQAADAEKARGICG